MTEENGFVVSDKRFSTSEEPEAEKGPEADVSGSQAEDDLDSAKAAEAASESHQALPQVNFPTFIVSLSSSVLVHLGEIDDPGTGQKAVNLPVAKQTIDILAMLDEKTQGNLDDDEARMLTNILYDLRMRYVALATK